MTQFYVKLLKWDKTSQIVHGNLYFSSAFIFSVNYVEFCNILQCTPNHNVSWYNHIVPRTSWCVSYHEVLAKAQPWKPWRKYLKFSFLLWYLWWILNVSFKICVLSSSLPHGVPDCPSVHVHFPSNVNPPCWHHDGEGWAREKAAVTKTKENLN